MTPLTEHLGRIGSDGGLLEFELVPVDDGQPNIDGQPSTGFVIAASDQHDHVMIVEVSISADGRGLTATVSTYAGNGWGVDPTITGFDHQVMVTVD